MDALTEPHRRLPPLSPSLLPRLLPPSLLPRLLRLIRPPISFHLCSVPTAGCLRFHPLFFRSYCLHLCSLVFSASSDLRSPSTFAPFPPPAASVFTLSSSAPTASISAPSSSPPHATSDLPPPPLRSHSRLPPFSPSLLPLLLPPFLLPRLLRLIRPPISLHLRSIPRSTPGSYMLDRPPRITPDGGGRSPCKLLREANFALDQPALQVMLLV